MDVKEDNHENTESENTESENIESENIENNKSVSNEIPKKKRGRPKKVVMPIEDLIVETHTSEGNNTSEVGNIPIEEVPKKKRGRPRKNKEGGDPVIKKRRDYVHPNLNGLGTEHPYESVNMEYEVVAYDDYTEAPF